MPYSMTILATARERRERMTKLERIADERARRHANRARRRRGGH